MPQLDLTFFPGQLFWLALTFGALYWLMSRVALPKVQATQDHRKGVVNEDLKVASEANDNAKATLARYERGLAEARTQAQVIIQDISLRAIREATTRQSHHQQDWDKRVQDAEDRINAARDAAVKQVKSLSSDIAATLVDRVLNGKKV